MRLLSTVLKAAAVASVLGAMLVAAECPNGCSGNGDCMAKDMCNCYKNFQGNDCADRTCLFSRAFVDTPRGDINMDQDRRTPNWILTNSQQSPAGTYEYFNPDAKQHEAHFYLECANKGICDRSTGLCQCFDGYEGNGCERTVCPNKCSGHGTCESIRELGHKAGGTLFGTEGDAGAVIYDLWDGNHTYGCRCDPWYDGPDCGKRTCKVGVDPLFLAVGTALYETFVVHAFLATGNVPATAWIRLRVFDYYGESYITQPITILDDGSGAAANAAAVEAAIQAVPNLTFKDVKCEAVGAGPDLGGYQSDRTSGTKGMSVICQYVDNPGRMRIPEVAAVLFDGMPVADQKAFVVTTQQQGHDNEWFTKQSTMYVDSVSADGLTITLTGSSPDPTSTVGAGQLIKYQQHILLATGATATTITLKYPFKFTLPTTPAPIFTTDAPTGATSFGLAAGTAHTTVTAVGDDKLIFTAAPAYTTGSTIFFHNAFYTIQELWSNSGGTEFYARLNKPFSGSSDDGGDGATTLEPWVVTMPTDKSKIYNYVSPCSGRGTCSTETGICTCFKGYTNDNCNTQNILAL